MTKYRQSSKLNNVLYDIRGPILEEANRMEALGHRILKLNIGNPAPFGFEAPDAIMMDIIRHLPVTQGYSDSHGLYSARTAIVQYYQNRGILDLDTNDIYLGNGVSELIPMTLQALCEPGDEILVPMPDYPLWTASTTLAGGNPVHYLCDEENNWYPDIGDIKSKITERTRGIVIINPNNPTGAVYSREILQQIADVAREHELVVFADEIYEKITYEGAEAINMATITGDDVLCMTFSGLSKAYRVCGYRAGWLAITGPKEDAKTISRALPCSRRCACALTCPPSMQFRPHSAATSPLTNSLPPAGVSTSSAPWRIVCSTKSTALPVNRPTARSTCFPKLIPKSSTSRATNSSCLTCSKIRRFSSATAAPLTGTSPTTSAWFSCQMCRPSRVRLSGWVTSWRITNKRISGVC